MATALPHIFVINMAKHEQRRTTMAQRLDSVGLPYEFFEATNGYELAFKDAPYYDRKKRLRYFGRIFCPAKWAVFYRTAPSMKKWVRTISNMRSCWKMM